ncbi:hypothetical protein [Dyadobacter sandarakinus]|uniref:Beta-lactamase-inhibitor-like, PepSY-like n=1 Tax=Dyadobacter sandarakinus TaxID=2747268 RepID=A0ABX7IBA7_9BACT|nr:hypothetical protein [Dyadobacter sandarakinus]QRR03098.1 hypothetical protein HWI92_20370 [Dyadobacter sandarakinus]
MFKSLKYALLIAIGLAGCTLEDHVVPDQTEQTLRRQIEQRLESYSGLAFRELPVKIYEANFDSRNTQYRMISDLEKILSISYKTAESVPQQVVDKIDNASVAGGVYSEQWRDSTNQFNNNLRVDYTLQGKFYSLINGMSNGSEFTYLTGRYEATYQLDKLSNLPQKAQDFINERAVPNSEEVLSLSLNASFKNAIINNNELKFVNAQVYHLPGGKRQYETRVSYYGATVLSIFFDESGEILWVASFDKLKKFIKTMDLADNPQLAYSNFSPDDIAEFEAYFAADPLYDDFYFDNSPANWKSDYEGVVGYELVLKNKSNSEQWYFRFDGNKKVVTSSFNF